MKRPFIPEVPGWGLAWTRRGGCQGKHSSPCRPDPHSRRGPPVAARSGPLTMLAFSLPVSPHLPNPPSPGSSGSSLLSLPQFCLQLGIFPKAPRFEQRLGCNSSPRTAPSFSPPTLAVPCPHPTGRHTNMHCMHIWMGTLKS